MQLTRLIVAVIAGLAILTTLVELIELLLVSKISQKSYDYLAAHRNYYFEIRNNSFIYYIKPLYTFFSASLAAFLGCLLASVKYRCFFIILLVVQSIGICYGMLFSPYKATLPIYYWLLIWIFTIAGIYMGTRCYQSMIQPKSP